MKSFFTGDGNTGRPAGRDSKRKRVPWEEEPQQNERILVAARTSDMALAATRSPRSKYPPIPFGPAKTGPKMDIYAKALKFCARLETIETPRTDLRSIFPIFIGSIRVCTTQSLGAQWIQRS